MSKTPEQMAQTMIANLKEKTGKTLPQWLQVAKKSGCEKHGLLVKHLKTEHGVTHGFANLIAHSHFGSPTFHQPSGDQVGAQYSGKKASLKPIYEALLAYVHSLGDDVEVSPKKAYVSLRRKRQFAIIQPSTMTRVDLGLRLDGVEPAGRLEAAGSFNSMVSHRVRLSAVEDIDKQVKAWLKQAYQDF